MKLSEKEKRERRKMLEKAWEEGSRRKGQWVRGGTRCINLKSARYRDVTKILKEQEKNDEVD